MHNPPKREKGGDNVDKKEKVHRFSTKDIQKMEQYFGNLETDTGALGLSLLAELKFSLQTLNKLKADIRKNGVVVEMDQGKYTIQRANPALQTYNVLIKNYQSLVKAILDLLPPESPPDSDDFDGDDL